MAKQRTASAKKKNSALRNKRMTEKDPSRYTISPPDVTSFRKLQKLADGVLLSRDPLWAYSQLYFEFQANNSGGDGYLRDMPFPSKRCRRGTKAPPVDTSWGRRPRGRPRKGSTRSEVERIAAEKARKKSDQVIQKNSKQRGRTENRIVALLFSAMNDIDIEESPLTHGIPPTRESKLNKKGRITTKSLHTEIRACLRKTMMTIISLQSEAIRVIVDMAFLEMDLLPSTTLTLARTFTCMVQVFETEKNPSQTDSRERTHDSLVTRSPMRLVEASLEATARYGQDWWRRNYRRNHDMPNALAMRRDETLLRASEKLLKP